jgi:MFS family permease
VTENFRPTASGDSEEVLVTSGSAASPGHFFQPSRQWGDGAPDLDADDIGLKTHSSFAPFAIPLFAAVWLTNTISNFGGQIQGVGAAWLMTELTRDPSTVSLVTSATLLPILLFSLISGAIADAFDRRRVLLVAQGVMFGASALLAWVAAGHITPTILIGLTFIIGCGFALNAPAWQAAVRELVPEHLVPAAIALNIIGFNLSRTAGPAVGGLVVAWGGPKASFAANAVSYVGLLAVLVVWLRRPPSHHAPRNAEPILAAIRSGLSFSLANPPLRRMFERITLFGVALGALLALLPLLVRTIGAGPEGLGLVFGCSGAGAVLGALLANRLRERFGREPLILVSIILTAIAMAGIALSPWIWLTAAAESLTGLGTTLVYTSFGIMAQQLAPRQLLGRILSIHQMAAFGGLAVGTGLWGAIAKFTGVRPAILIAASAMLVLTLRRAASEEAR